MKTRRILFVLLAVALVLGIMCTTVSAEEENYGIEFAGYLDLPFMEEPMFQWSDIGATDYSVDLYAEDGTYIDFRTTDEANYLPARELIPYTGRFYIEVTAINAGTYEYVGFYRSEVFDAADKYAPGIMIGREKRTHEEKGYISFIATVRPGEVLSYYYEMVDSGSPEPLIDTSGKGIEIVDGYDNYIHFESLTPGAKDIYIIAKDGDGNTSGAFKTTLPAYTPACICETPCYNLTIMDSGCPICTASGDVKDCLGIPELESNGGAWRLGENEAEVGFTAFIPSGKAWNYHYLVDGNKSYQPEASEIIEKGIKGVHEDVVTLKLTELTKGENYIHIVLCEEGTGRVTNVLRMTIPEFLPLTITPVAAGGEYDEERNTLTLDGGGDVEFLLNTEGYVHCESHENVTPTADAEENSTLWSVTLPNTSETYTFYYGLGGLEARCTVVVNRAFIKLGGNNSSDFEIQEGTVIIKGGSDIKELDLSGLESSSLVINPGSIASGSGFQFTTGQGLGVGYSEGAMGDVLSNAGNEVKIETELNSLEPTINSRNAKKIAYRLRSVISSGSANRRPEKYIEKAIKQIENYGVGDLLLIKDAFIALTENNENINKDLVNALLERIDSLIEKKQEQLSAQNGENAIAAFSINTYSVAGNGSLTYIPVGKTMSFSIPADTGNLPENAILRLFRLNDDGTRSEMEIVSVSDGLVNAQTGGNSDYILVYTLDTDKGGLPTGALIAIFAGCFICVLGALAAAIILRKKKIG